MTTQTDPARTANVTTKEEPVLRYAHDSRLGCSVAYTMLHNVDKQMFTVVGTMCFAHKQVSNRANTKQAGPDQFSRAAGRKVAGSRLKEYLRQLARGYGVKIPFFLSYKIAENPQLALKDQYNGLTRAIDFGIQEAFRAVVARNRSYEVDSNGTRVTDAYRKISRSQQVENSYVLNEVYEGIVRELKAYETA